MSKQGKGTGKPVDVAVDYLTRLLAAGLQQAMTTGNTTCECDACHVTRSGALAPQGFKVRSIEKLSDGTDVALPPCLVDYSALSPPQVTKGKKGAPPDPPKDTVPMLAQAILRQAWIAHMPRGRTWGGEVLPASFSGKVFELNPSGIPIETLDSSHLPLYIQLPIPDPPVDPPPDSQTPWLTFWMPWVCRCFVSPPRASTVFRTLNGQLLIPLQLCIDCDSTGKILFRPYTLDRTYAAIANPTAQPLALLDEPLVPMFPGTPTTHPLGGRIGAYAERPMTWTLKNGMALTLTLEGFGRGLDHVLPIASAMAMPPFGLLPWHAPTTLGEVCAIVATSDKVVWQRLQQVLNSRVTKIEEGGDTIPPAVPSTADSLPPAKDAKSTKGKKGKGAGSVSPPSSPPKLDPSATSPHIRGDEFYMAAQVAVQHCMRFCVIPRDMSNESCSRIVQAGMHGADSPQAALAAQLVAALRTLFFSTMFEELTWCPEGIRGSRTALSCFSSTIGMDDKSLGMTWHDTGKSDTPLAAELSEGPLPELLSWMVAYAITVSALTQDSATSMRMYPPPGYSDSLGCIWTHQTFEEIFNMLKVFDAAVWSPARVRVLIHNSLSCLECMETVSQNAIARFGDGGLRTKKPIPPLTVIRVMIRILLLYMHTPLAMYCRLAPSFPSLWIDPASVAPLVESGEESLESAAAGISCISTYLRNTNSEFAKLKDSRAIAEKMSGMDADVVKALMMSESRALQGTFNAAAGLLTQQREAIMNAAQQHNNALIAWTQAHEAVERAQLTLARTEVRSKHADERAENSAKRVAELEGCVAQVEAVLNESKDAQKELRGLKGRVSNIETERNKLRSERDKDKSALATARSQLTTLEGVKKGLETSITDLERELARIRDAPPSTSWKAELASAQASSKAAQAAASEAESQADAMRRKLDEARKQYVESQAQAHQAVAAKSVIQEKLSAVTAEQAVGAERVAALEAQLHQVRNQLLSDAANAEETDAALQADIVAADMACAILWRQINAMGTSLQSVAQMRDQLAAKLPASETITSNGAAWMSGTPMFGSMSRVIDHSATGLGSLFAPA